MRILALDLGRRRIGLAINDELGITAQGLETLRTMKTLKIIGTNKAYSPAEFWKRYDAGEFKPKQ